MVRKTVKAEWIDQMIVIYKPLIKNSKVDPSKEVQSGCVLSYSTVFNIDQVDLTNSSFKEFET